MSRRSHRRFCAALVLLLSFGTSLASGQDNTLTLGDVLRSARQWANENLDSNVLRTLRDVDQDQVKQLLDTFQEQFQGQYVVELAPLRDSAKALLPLLEQYEETAPYAAWLKTRMDYLDVAGQLRLIIPPPQAQPGKPPVPRPNPSARLERRVWIRELSHRPWPRAARPYLTGLKAIFKQEGVPPDLVWIAEVESSFDPKAESPEGAAGMFQLMPATAQRYGLRLRPADQRYNPEDSARAAAKYLRFLHRHFQDWRLAVAAYNAGEGTVDKLLRESKARNFDAISSRLPAETQMYVPKVEATLLRREGRAFSQL